MRLIFVSMLLFCLVLSGFAQNANSEKDAAWVKINKLAREFWNKEDNTKEESAEELIKALKHYIEGKELTTEREQIALSMLISIYKKYNLHRKLLNLAEDFIKENDIQNEFQHLLRLEVQSSLFALDKFDVLFTKTEKHLKLIKKVEVTDNIRVIKSKALMYQGKAIIMLKKDGVDKVLAQIEIIIEKFSNNSNVLPVKLAKSELQRFLKLHPGAKLEDLQAINFLKDENVNLSDYSGKKLVILFWASQEGKCSYFFENKCEKFLTLLKENKIEFVAISSDAVEAQQKFIDEYNLSCDYLFDKQSKIIRELVIEEFPYFVFVNENGEVIFTGNLNSYDSLKNSISK